MDLDLSIQSDGEAAPNGANDPQSSPQEEAPEAETEARRDEPFTSAERIRELLAIDSDVTRILQKVGLAIQSLTSNVPTEDDETPLEAAKRSFGSRTNEFVILAQSVTARLRRQVYALEEANIIAANRAAAESQQAAPPAPPRPNAPRYGAGAPQKQEPPMQITNGGLGNLDVSWLNSRSDKVGEQKEAELWSQARKHMEKMLAEGDHVEGEDETHSMEVDEKD